MVASDNLIIPGALQAPGKSSQETTCKTAREEDFWHAPPR